MDKYPSSPDAPEKNLSSIYFTVNDPEKIYRTIVTNSSKDIILTKALLEVPLYSLDIAAYGIDANTFDMFAQLTYSFEDENRVQTGDIVNHVASMLSHDGKLLERGGNYIINGPRGTELVLGNFPADDILWLSTGHVPSEIEEEDDTEIQRLVNPPELNVWNVEDVLSDYTEVLEMITQVSYDFVGKLPSTQEILVEAPRLSVSEKLARVAMRGIEDITDSLEVKMPGVTFSNIGGQQKAKEELEGLVFAISNPDLYRKWGTVPPKGILLHGPPGTGKTLLATALAAEANARFLHVKTSDINSKWYGDTERAMQGIFDYASRDGEKTIIYFDEIDTMVPQRDGSHEVTQRTTGVLLQNVDGMDASSNITIVASTNRKDAIDSAMTRPGRIDRLIEVALPNEKEREEIFGVHLKKADEIARTSLFDNIDLAALAKSTNRYSGADIAEIIRRTLEQKVRLDGKGLSPSPVQTSDILSQITAYEHIRKTSSERPGFRTNV